MTAARRVACAAGVFVLALIPLAASGQLVPRAEPVIGVLDATEEKRLREVLARPTPQGATYDTLRRHFQELDAAANSLGDNDARERLLRDAVALLPDWNWLNSLAVTIRQRGASEEADRLIELALARADSPNQRAFLLVNRSGTLLALNRQEAATRALDDADAIVQRGLTGTTTPAVRQYLQRVQINLIGARVEVHLRRGQLHKAIEVAQAGTSLAMKMLEQEGPNAPVSLKNDLANALLRPVDALKAAGRLHEAEQTILHFLRIAAQMKLPAAWQAGAFRRVAQLRLDQREFALADRYSMQADEAFSRLGRPGTGPARTQLLQGRLLALAGLRRWDDADRLLAQFDALPGAAPPNSRLDALVFERGIVHLGQGRWVEAVAALEPAFASTMAAYGDTHFLTAQGGGLLGAALWRSGRVEDRPRALALLKAAATGYTGPIGADHSIAVGLRQEWRDVVFAALMEAVALTPGEDATSLIGIADWLRSSLVQAAIADAAVRSAASNPSTAEWVRNEQDMRNEILALREFLAAEIPPRPPLPPAVVEQTRARLAVLESSRLQLQQQIKAAFPEFDRLVRPALPTASAIATQLRPEEVLLVIHPTVDAVYVWAQARDRPPAFVRVPLDARRLAGMVDRMRAQLDLAEGAGAGRLFDAGIAHDLFRELLLPVHPVWTGKPEWVLAAGGSLARLPFSLLHTQAGGGKGVQGPWLLHQAAITQIPSAGAWLAIRSRSLAAAAPEALMGLGDPQFGAVMPESQATRGVRQLRAHVGPAGGSLEGAGAAPPSAALTYARMPPLPETRDELLAIASTLGAEPKRDLLFGAQATRQAVLDANASGALSRRRVLAFATHGLVAGELPSLTQPALALATTGNEDKDPLAPLLTLQDVLTLRLNADWVVLSACNTAAGDGQAEEALSGLARGFLYAGARSLLVTHWSVESESAKLLTSLTFAHHLANPRATKAESLRRAMLEVMAQDRYAHPSFWAPYVLIGDSRR